MTRRSALVATGLAILAVGTAGAGFAQSAVAAGPKSGDDALVLRTISEVEHFSAWLGGKPGLVGEFGVPAYNNATGDVDKFTHLLSRFFDRADELALNTQGWVAANWSGGTASHSMGVYNNAANDGRINNASVAARVLESRYAYGAAHGLLRGVNLSGIDHPEARRTDGPAVFVPTAADVAYLASRGVKSIRLPSMWEHLQPNLGGPLDTTRLAVLQQIITACASNGIRVILDLAHNYGRYELPSGGGLQTIALSSGPLTAAHLADFWSKVATWVKADPTRASTVHSFDIMNEPHDLAAEAGTGGSVIYDFESGTTQGFEANHAWISLANSTADKFAGTRSLRIAPVTGTYQHNFFSVQRPGTFTPTGSTVVVRVKSITAGASVVAAVQDQAYTQHPGSAVPLAQNQWTTVTVAIPGTVTSITNLILNFQGVTATSTQPFYVDDLGYGQQSMAPAVVWERIAQAVVSAIRAVDATRPIIVPTYQYSAMQRVSELHPAGPWITDTNIWYQAHSYWDRQRGGFWTNTDGSPESYAQSLAAA